MTFYQNFYPKRRIEPARNSQIPCYVGNSCVPCVADG
jgi:hypothetical protein